MTDRLVSPQMSEEEQAQEGSLRPRRLAEYIGQEKIKENLNILLEAARKRSESVDHVLLYGPPGLGKTTLCNIIAAEMGVSLRTTSGPAIEHAGDLASILTSLQTGEVLFIDEIHPGSSSRRTSLFGNGGFCSGCDDRQGSECSFPEALPTTLYCGWSNNSRRVANGSPARPFWRNLSHGILR